MNQLNNINKHYNDEKFNELDLPQILLEEVTFSHCQFSHCHFNEAKWLQCKFNECEFTHCDLNMAHIAGTLFSDVVFSDSKLMGINWTTARWPQIKLITSIGFYRCNINHSSFFELSLIEIIIESCKAQNVDFRGADLSHGKLTGTDFEKTLFQHTKLKSADLTDSINYNIDPMQNEIKKAKFSFPEAIALLNHFDIEIEGLE